MDNENQSSLTAASPFLPFLPFLPFTKGELSPEGRPKGGYQKKGGT